MKTFKQLTVGDKLYVAHTDYRGKERPSFETINVRRIELEEVEKKKCLVINKRGGSYGDFRGYVFELDNCDTNILQKDKDGYFTTEYPLLVKCLRDAGMKHIKDVEREIKEREETIKKIRIAYWDYLNNLTETPILESDGKI